MGMRVRSWKTAALTLAVMCLVLLVPFIPGCRSGPRESLTVLRFARQDEWASHLSDNMAPGSLYLVAGTADDLPKDWLPCIGQILNRQDYPELFAVVGAAYTHGSVAADQFALPDFHGMFALDLQPGALPWWLGSQSGHSNLALGPANPIVAASESSAIVKATEMMWVVKAR
jgi:hypothetical protein